MCFREVLLVSFKEPRFLVGLVTNNSQRASSGSRITSSDSCIKVQTSSFFASLQLPCRTGKNAQQQGSGLFPYQSRSGNKVPDLFPDLFSFVHQRVVEWSKLASVQPHRFFP